MRIPFYRMLFVCAEYGRALDVDGIYFIVIWPSAEIVIIELSPGEIQHSTSLYEFRPKSFLNRMEPAKSMKLHLLSISLAITRNLYEVILFRIDNLKKHSTVC